MTPDQPTPETDAQTFVQEWDCRHTMTDGSGPCVDADFARRLERELYAFCAELGHEITSADSTESAHGKVVSAMAELQSQKRERDTLRERLRLANEDADRLAGASGSMRMGDAIAAHRERMKGEQQ